MIKEGIGAPQIAEADEVTCADEDKSENQAGKGPLGCILISIKWATPERW